MQKKSSIFISTSALILTIIPTILCTEQVIAYEGSQFTNQTPGELTLITLEQAIQQTLLKSPRIRSASAQLGSLRGSVMQASVLLPNPEIGFEAENIAGTGDFSSANSAEYTYRLAQRIEINGAREFRMRASKQEVMQGQYDLIITRLDLIRDVRVAYANAVSVQEMLELSRERKNLEQALIETVRKRVKAASAPVIQLRKAEIGVATAHVLIEKLERELKHAKHVLTSLWEGHNESLILDNSKFFILRAPLNEEEVESILPDTADLKRYEAEYDRAEALFQLEQAEAISDATISVSYRDFRESGDQALVAGVSLPIPLFDANHGNIERARNMIDKAKSDRVESYLQLQNEVFERLEGEVNAYHYAKTLKDEIIPTAEEAFKLAREGYEAGRFPYLEVLDAQRTLFEVKEQYITALKQYHESSAYVERYTTIAGDAI